MAGVYHARSVDSMGKYVPVERTTLASMVDLIEVFDRFKNDLIDLRGWQSPLKLVTSCWMQQRESKTSQIETRILTVVSDRFQEGKTYALCSLDVISGRKV